MTFADGSGETFAFDADGNLTSRTDTASSGNKVSTYAYDALNHVTRQAYPNNQTNSYTYDKVGNLASLTDGGGTVNYSYDERNLLTGVAEPGGSCTSAPPSKCTTFGYDDDGNRTSTTYPNGVTVSSSFDAADRLTDTTAKNPTGSTLKRFSYKFLDPATSKDTALRQSVTDEASNQTTYSYDKADRLTQATTKDSGGTTTDDYAYTYDGAGNHTSQTTKVNGGSPTTQTLAYNAANQLCWSAVGSFANPSCATPPTGANIFGYDANGNELSASGNGLQLTWNAKDQNTAVQPSSTSTSQPQGYLGPNQTERTQVGSVTLQNNILGVGARSTSTSTTYFTRDSRGTLVSGRPPSASSYYYIFDGLGSVVGLTDSTGALNRAYKYGPAGGISGANGPSTLPTDYFRYRGAYYGSAQMYHFGMRDYDPALRRWTQQDPIDQPDDLRQADRYVYAGDDPVNEADRSGTDYYREYSKAGALTLGAALSVGASQAAGASAALPPPLDAIGAGLSLGAGYFGENLYGCGLRATTGCTVHAPTLHPFGFHTGIPYAVNFFAH